MPIYIYHLCKELQYVSLSPISGSIYFISTILKNPEFYI